MRDSVRRGLVRLLVVVLPAVGLAIVPATASMAARCATGAHAYVRDDFTLTGWLTVTESDPVDPASYPYSFHTPRMPQSGLLTFGANGMTPGEYPYWNFYNSAGEMVRTVIGARAGDNCVSGQVSVYMDLPTDTYSVRATYYRGNAGGAVVGQKHFQVTLAPIISGGPFTLRNRGYTSDCMDLAFGDPANGTAIGRYPCDDAVNRKWYLENSGLTRICHGVWLGQCGNDYDLYDTVRIRSVATGKCADIDPDRMGNGGPIREWDCTGANSQRWVVQRSSRFGGYTFFNAHVRDRINEAKAVDAGPGYQLQLWDAFGDSVVQAWDVQPTTVPPPPPTTCGDRTWYAVKRFPSGWSCATAKGTLAMQGDGNLVIYSEFGAPLWASHTAGWAGAYAEFDADGYFSVYSVEGWLLWSTFTPAPGGRLVYQDDGNLVVYNGSGQPVWAANMAH